MDEESRRNAAASSHTPPPCDPFQRYQTPWPRNRDDDENPFIRFRRFADERLKSMFSGIPFVRRSFDEHFENIAVQHRKETNAALQEIIERFERSKQELDQLRLKREQEAAENTQIPYTQDLVLERNAPSTELDMYDHFSTENLDPFVNKDDTYAWLLSSPYSPIWLSSPLKAHSSIGPEPTFPTLCRPNTKDEDRIADLRWHSAFQDLLSLERTGKLDEPASQRPASTALWLTELYRKDFLTFQPKTLSSQSAINMWKPVVSNIPILNLQWQGIRFVNDLWANAGYRDQGEDDDDYMDYEDEDEMNEDPVTPPMPNNEIERKSIARTWAQALSAVGQTIEDVFGSTDHSPESEVPMSPPNDARPSIISTMTRTETRTLPDGSIETRRVLRRRFADGNEEHEETVDTQPAIRPNRQHDHDDLASPAAFKVEKETLPQISLDDPAAPKASMDSKERSGSGGWFWR